MSAESQIDKVLANAGQLGFLGPNRALLALLFALWAARKRPGLLSRLLGTIALGIGGYGCWLSAKKLGEFGVAVSIATKCPLERPGRHADELSPWSPVYPWVFLDHVERIRINDKEF
jgi:hypothetical protein